MFALQAAGLAAIRISPVTATAFINQILGNLPIKMVTAVMGISHGAPVRLQFHPVGLHHHRGWI
jgi:hypothetical protein